VIQRAAALSALLLVSTSCHHAPPPILPPGAIPISVSSLQADSIAHSMIQVAFAADAKLTTPDSTYIPDSEVIANGAPRGDAPRLAGVSANGAIELGSSRFAVTGNFVWGSVQYRWMPNDTGGQIVEGWATLVIARTRSGDWRILELHSSTVPPPTNP
jgi:hypothetical protein